jgi:ubiquinone/menaquinone biosynthesis C-methylase UbiE
MENIWSTYIQTSEELYGSRSVRFREDNKDLWLSAMKLHDGMNVLELGCGGGSFCHRIKTFLPNCCVTGLDRDAGHIQYAIEKSTELNLDCSFVQGDALSLPFADNSFDACTSHTVFEHVETAGFLREQYRVLRPGGVLSVLVVLTRMNSSPQNQIPVTQQEQLLTDKVWERAKEFDRTHGIGRLITECDLPKALEQAGFVHISVNFIAVASYAPDNADCSRELALAQINCNRMLAIESVRKALRIDPEGLSDTEKNMLCALINERFDKRIALYEQGQKLWDIASSNVMSTTGVKPQ